MISGAVVWLARLGGEGGAWGGMVGGAVVWLGTVSFIIPPTFGGIFHEGGRGGTANPPEIV